MEGQVKIKRVLISVSEKSGILRLAGALKSYGCEIVSTGGTRKVLLEGGIDVTDIASVTGSPEAFGGRMKTLSFNVCSALLFDRGRDAAEARDLKIEPIDMVVCNLYPFKKFMDAGSDIDILVENIDIGGPTMIRAAAKNYKYVAAVTDVSDYEDIINELRGTGGYLSLDTRVGLMRKAYNHTADYDALVACAMDERFGERSVRLGFSRGKMLRYGENPHQRAWFFAENGAENPLYDMRVLHGKELSYNNTVDINGAAEVVRGMKKSGCAIVKHTNPCGLCEGDDQRRAFELAWAGDPVSAFGSVIAFNKKVDLKTVEFLALDSADRTARKFVEVVAAPSFSEGAVEYLKKHRDIRIIEYDMSVGSGKYDLKYIRGSLLIQDHDDELRSKFEMVTAARPVREDMELFEFGMYAARCVKSNAIAVVRRTDDGFVYLCGMGAGQPNRLNSTSLAIARSRETLNNECPGETGVDIYVKNQMAKAILASDAFFPFPDNIDECAKAGIKTIIQPGGSIRDRQVIEACDRNGIAMIFTGTRHFKH